MKRLALLFLLLVIGPTAALAAFAIFQTSLPSNPNLRQENFFGLTGSAWQSFAGSYAPSLGSPAVSTADYYHLNGLAWVRPVDLASAACVSAGATTTNGRYLWVMTPDHPGGNYNWNGGSDFRLGYSNDPGVLPSTLTNIYSGASTASAQIATITAKIDNGAGGAGNILTVTAVSGLIMNDGHANVTGAGVTTATVNSQSTGSQGLTGTYVLSGAAQNVASQAMTVVQTNYGLYQNPFFVCNPDDVTTPFYLYAEGSASGVQHEEGLIKSADLVTWTSPLPTHVTNAFGAWSSYQRPVRDGVNSWHSTGLQVNYISTGNTNSYSKWTSTDGNIWTQGSSTINACIPSNPSNFNCPAASAQQSNPEGAPDSITAAAQTWSMTSIKNYVSGSRSGSEWVGRLPIDASYNVLASPSPVKISSAYAGSYPGPTYLQTTTGYVEDGIAHYWGSTGFFTSSSIFGLTDAATYANGGGFWQQGLDYYTEIIDASAAAGAAPVGVRASCASSVASLVWYDVLPTNTYRLYYGTTAGTQATLVGDFTGTTATYSGMTLNAVGYYKLVYLNGGTEKKNRVVSTYCSTSSAFVNAHLTRASAGGADMTTCNRTFMDTFDTWLTSNSLSSNLLFATMPEFCVARSGSVISKIFDMGTTRLPRGGDFTPTTANTAYNATGINSKPAWVNSTNTAYGYYGGGPQGLNNIRRKTQITLFSGYQKPGTALANPFVIGQFASRMMLSHTAGTPGAINCLLSDATQQKTATATVSGLATDVHTNSCTFDGTTLLAYSDAVAGSGQTGLVIPSPNLNPPDMLTGQVGFATLVNVLMSGSDTGQYNSSTASYGPGGNAALASWRAQMIFDKALTGAQMTSLDALVR